MKIVSTLRSDLLGITARADYWEDETSEPGRESDVVFTATKLAGELVEFTFSDQRKNGFLKLRTSRTYSWTLIRETIAAAKLAPEFLSVCATLSCPAISRD